MRRWMTGLAVLSVGVAAPIGAAWAQYRPSPRREELPEQKGFDDAVDLKRFRRGNIGWDTQELIASGLTALHKEQVRILDQLGRIESRLERLEKKIDERE